MIEAPDETSRQNNTGTPLFPVPASPNREPAAPTVDGGEVFCYFIESWNSEAETMMKEPTPTCQPGEHVWRENLIPPASLERAAQLFRAMGDAPRLRILELLETRELCVTEIVAALQDKFSTVSQRLRILRQEGLIVRRREGNHLFYALADRHVADLIMNALAHARELDAAPARVSQEGDD
jgi:ArsR family transcriptional regulator